MIDRLLGLLCLGRGTTGRALFSLFALLAGVSASAADAPQRIVSLAPSITETLFAIGAGSRVVGVTEFCSFPAEAGRLPKVGGYYDPNYEAILALRPDLVVLLPESAEHRRKLAALRIPTLTVEQHSLAGVLDSFILLGQVCGCEAGAACWIRNFQDELAGLQRRVRGGATPKVLLVLGRDYGSGRIQEAYVAGRGEIYDELLSLAGGRNAFPGGWPKYPKLSAEGILSLKPDIILEFVPALPAGGREQIRAAWAGLPGYAGKVEILAGAYLTIPGPRLLLTVKQMALALHPELARP